MFGNARGSCCKWMEAVDLEKNVVKWLRVLVTQVVRIDRENAVFRLEKVGFGRIFEK